MKKANPTLYCIVFVTLMMVGCSGGFDKDTGTYEGKGFSLRFPLGWERTKTTAGALISVSNQELTANINIMVQELPQSVSFDQYIKKLSVQHARMGARQREQGDITLAGIEGHWAMSNITAGGQKFTTISYIVMKGSTVYSIVSLAKAELFADLEQTFDEVARSLKFD